MKKTVSWLCFFLFLTLTTQAIACDFCAIYIARQASVGSKRGFHLGVFEQFTHFGRLQKEGKRVANTHEESLNSSITQFVMGYHFSKRFSVQLNIPLIFRYFKRFDGTKTEKGNQSGLGDISVLGKFLAYEKSKENFNWALTLNGGFKLPSGSTHGLSHQHNGDEDESGSGIHDHDLALGSGSFDFILGTQSELRWKRFVFDTQVQGWLRTEGAHHYRYGHELHWDLSAGFYAFLTHSRSLTVKAKASGEWKGLDQVHGISMQDTGMKTLYVGPELNFTAGSHLSLQLSVQLPVGIENTGLQLVPDSRIQSSLIWRF